MEGCHGEALSQQQFRLIIFNKALTKYNFGINDRLRSELELAGWMLKVGDVLALSCLKKKGKKSAH